jgi:hypothetical protein
MNLHAIVVGTLRVLSDPLGLVNSKKRKNSFLGDFNTMISQRKLAKLFREPVKNASEIIEDQLDRCDKRFEILEAENRMGDARALAMEYMEWAITEEGDNYGFLFMERIAEY